MLSHIFGHFKYLNNYKHVFYILSITTEHPISANICYDKSAYNAGYKYKLISISDKHSYQCNNYISYIYSTIDPTKVLLNLKCKIHGIKINDEDIGDSEKKYCNILTDIFAEYNPTDFVVYYPLVYYDKKYLQKFGTYSSVLY